MTQLALDFDNPRKTNMGGNMDRLEKALKYLRKRFGAEHVFLRRSSSGDGWHVWVDIDLEPEDEMNIRRRLGDCPGRRISDKGRLKAGLRTSRLFGIKGETVMSEDWKSGTTKTKRAKGWKSC